MNSTHVDTSKSSFSTQASTSINESSIQTHTTKHVNTSSDSVNRQGRASPQDTLFKTSPEDRKSREWRIVDIGNKASKDSSSYNNKMQSQESRFPFTISTQIFEQSRDPSNPALHYNAINTTSQHSSQDPQYYYINESIAVSNKVLHNSTESSSSARFQDLPKKGYRSRSDSVQSNASAHSSKSKTHKPIKIGTLSNLFAGTSEEPKHSSSHVGGDKYNPVKHSLRRFVWNTFIRFSMRLNRLDQHWSLFAFFPDLIMLLLCFGILQWNGFGDNIQVEGCSNAVFIGIVIYLQGCLSFFSFFLLYVIPSVIYARNPKLNALLSRVITILGLGIVILLRLPLAILILVWLSKKNCGPNVEYFWWAIIPCFFMWINILWGVMSCAFGASTKIFQIGVLIFYHRIKEKE